MTVADITKSDIHFLESLVTAAKAAGITPATLATGATALGVPTVSAVAAGADPTGTSDSGPAINTAIAALPTTGGNVYLGPGNFKISTTVLMGTGTSSTASTRTGINLIGGPCAVGVTNIPGPNGARGACRLFSGAAVDMLHVNGPIEGWGLQNIDFDGVSLGLVGVTETACQYGNSSGCRIRNFVTAQQVTQSVPILSFNTNHMHNRYTDFSIEVPKIDGSIGIWCRGNGINTTTNSCFDVWDGLYVTLAAATAGVTLTGLRLQGCDTQYFSKIHFVGPDQVSGGGVAQSILFDYTGEVSSWPSACFFERVNFNTTNTSVFNKGVGGSTPHSIVFMASENHTPPDPQMSKVNWGVTAANP